MLLTCAFRNVARFAGAFRRAPAVWESLAGRSLHKAADSAQRLLAADVKRLAAERMQQQGVAKADQIMAASIARSTIPAGGTAGRAAWRIAGDLARQIPGVQLGETVGRALERQARKQNSLVRLANRIARLEADRHAADVAASRVGTLGQLTGRRGRPISRILWNGEKAAKLAKLQNRFALLRARAATVNVPFKIGGATVWAKYGPVGGDVRRGRNGWSIKVHAPKWAGCPAGLARRAGDLLQREVRAAGPARLAMQALRGAL